MRGLTVLVFSSLLTLLGLSTPAQAAEVHTASLCLDAAAEDPVSVSATGCSPTATQLLKVAVCVEPEGNAEGNQCDGFFTCSGPLGAHNLTSYREQDDLPVPDAIICIETPADSTIRGVYDAIDPVLTHVIDEYIRPALNRIQDLRLFVCSQGGCSSFGPGGRSSPDDCNAYLVQEDDLLVCVVHPEP